MLFAALLEPQGSRQVLELARMLLTSGAAGGTLRPSAGAQKPTTYKEQTPGTGIVRSGRAEIALGQMLRSNALKCRRTFSRLSIRVARNVAENLLHAA